MTEATWQHTRRSTWRSRRAVRLRTQLATYLVLGLGAAVIMVPFFWMLSTSLKEQADVYLYPPRWIPNPIRFANYDDVRSLVPFFTYAKNSLIIVASVMFGTVLSSSFTAYGFARLLLDHPANTLQVGAELDAGTLIVCDLVSGVSPRQTLRLGNLLMALLINAALDREPQAKRRPWIVIADEFDQLAGDFFRYSLDKLRAAGLSIVAAHQNLSQIPSELASSFASVPIKLYFRPSALDVPLLKRLYPGTSALWSSLQQHQVAVHVEDAAEEGLYWPVEEHGWEVAETADWPEPVEPTRLAQLTARMLAPPYTLPRAAPRASDDQEPAQAPHPRSDRQDPAAGADRPGTADPAPARPPRLVGERPDRIPLVSRQPDPRR